MSARRIPDLLNRLASAGDEGVPLTDDPLLLLDLDLCAAAGFPVRIAEQRVYLPFDSDSLVPAWIEAETPNIAWPKLIAEGYLELDSTNAVALAGARQGAATGLLVCAETQTAGKGRRGRRWSSPPGAGLYFTLVLRPPRPHACWTLLNLIASVAVAQAIADLERESVVPQRLLVDLKWPNDVLVSGKKAAGILVETAGSGGSPYAAVVGVGVNVREGFIPEELKGRATSVSAEAGVQVPKRWLLVRFLYHFQLGYDAFVQGRDQEIVAQWKSHSTMWDATPVWVEDNTERIRATTSGLTELGALRIRTEEGTEEIVLAADVTIRQV